MWRRARDAEAALAAAATAAPKANRARARVLSKRRAQDQPDGQPTPKKSARGLDDDAIIEDAVGHAPAKGLLASAAEAEAHPDGVEEEDSVPASPEPTGTAAGTSQGKDASTIQREKSPALPKNIGDADEYGFRLYNQRSSTRASGASSRLFAPRIFDFEDWEIGFRDTSNDSSKGHTRAKRGKYLDKPNTTGMHFDHWCNGYDFGVTEPEDFDEEVVRRHNVHPLYGIFLADSKNDVEDAQPYYMPGKPVVYIANPSGRISHASRSFTSTINHRRAEEAPLRTKFRASLSRFCKLAEVEDEEISTTDYVRTEDQMRNKALRTASKELKARPRERGTGSDDDDDMQDITEDDADAAISAVSVLTYASAFVEASDIGKPSAPVKPARYDAIRDVFTDSKPAAPPVQEERKSLELNFLAELCNVEARLPGGIDGSDIRSTIKKEEPSSNTYGLAPPSREPEPVTSFSHMSRSDRAFPQPPGSSVIPDSYSNRHAPPPPPPVNDYKTSPLAPPPHHDHGYPYSHNGYPAGDMRDSHMSTGRPLDVGYNPRRVSGYGSDAPPPPPPSYPRPYWPQPSGPPPVAGGPAPPPSHYSSSSLAPPPPPPAPAAGRMGAYGQSASGDLPPLRPPRNRSSLSEDPAMDPMRSNLYYPPGPSRSYHRGYPEPVPSAPLHGIGGDRMLPTPQQPASSYMGSPPPPSYNGQVLSPTFSSHHPPVPGPAIQSPPGTPSGHQGSVQRHRSTPSGSSDAGSAKYRKLQPAPVPAHRSWPNKPELKTIPYDHKDNGSGAALPNSGPTQIRGWNVNQPRKRSKVEKERQDSANEESR